eukprot:10379581-Alexandrium_andersonii.AAC.1
MQVCLGPGQGRAEGRRPRRDMPSHARSHFGIAAAGRESRRSARASAMSVTSGRSLTSGGTPVP